MTELDSTGRVPYVYPNQDYIILGGVKRDFGSSKKPSNADREWILEKTQDFYPSLEYVAIIEEKVGLRTARDETRLEMEKLKERNTKAKAVIHNYGHEGWGLSMYLGSGEEVVKLFDEFLEKA